jgi:hypothetical protein
MKQAYIIVTVRATNISYEKGKVNFTQMWWYRALRSIRFSAEFSAYKMVNQKIKFPVFFLGDWE